MKCFNIGFFGTSDFALKALEKLYNINATIKFVVSQSPKRSGRGKKVSLSPVGVFAVKKKSNYLLLKKFLMLTF